MRFRPPAAALAMALLVCCWREDASDRKDLGRFVVDTIDLKAAPWKLTLHDEACPSRTLTVSRSTDPEDHTDQACLAALAPGARVNYQRRRMRQGCMPGKVYWSYLDDCSIYAANVQLSSDRCPPAEDAWQR